ncbi:MAG TPA: hypothetical protein IAB50_07820 [Candidatus Faecivicinus avistercoris]|nr:hypothetical protein [Candidatus Faecivicinus avistercoris]
MRIPPRALCSQRGVHFAAPLVAAVLYVIRNLNLTCGACFAAPLVAAVLCVI